MECALFLLKYTWSFDWWLPLSTSWTCFCTLILPVLLFCRIGFIWVLAILDSALQINIHIKARSFYFHIIPVLRLHLWSLVIVIALPMIDPMWLVPILRHLKWEIVLWVVSANFRAILVRASLKFGLKKA